MARTKGSKNKSKEEQLLEILDNTEIPFEELKVDQEFKNENLSKNKNNISNEDNISDDEEDSNVTIVQINDLMRVLVTRRNKTLQVYRKGKHPVTKQETEGWTFEGYHGKWKNLLLDAIDTGANEKILSKNEVQQLKDVIKIIKDMEKEVKKWFEVKIEE